MKFIRKKDNETLFINFWNEYKNHNITGTSYNLDLIKYYLITEKEALISDESFVYVNEETPPKCLGICFFPIYKNDKFTYCNSVAPLASHKKYLDSCFTYIESLISKFKVSQIELHIDINFSQHGEWKYNYLRDYGYIDSTINDSIFPLNDSRDNLFYRINRSSRKLIKKTLKIENCNINIYDKDNITTEVFYQYKKCHYICAGRQTRSDKSFDYALELIKNGQGVLLEITLNKEGIGYLVIFLLENKYVILSSIANIPEYEIKIPIYRMLYWKAIQLFANEYEVLYYGYPAGNSMVEGFKSYMDKKQLEIARYKKYMGGITVPHYRGIRYMDRKLMLKDVNTFKEKIGEHYEDSI